MNLKTMCHFAVISVCFVMFLLYLMQYEEPQIAEATPLVTVETGCDDLSASVVSCTVKKELPVAKTDDIDEQFILLDDNDIALLSLLLYYEGRGESEECQKGIISVVMNRFLTGDYDSFEDVIYEPHQFSCASLIDLSDKVPEAQLEIVKDICKNGPIFPEYVIYFRASKYHTFKDAKDYKRIDNTYFSYSKRLYEKYIERIRLSDDLRSTE